MVSWHLFVSCLTLCIANSLSIPRSHSNRATAKPLSDEIHYGGDSEHNPEFDHEAFLGEEEARHFDELSPEESKFRLGLLFDRIDTNSDSSLSTSELQDWITKIQFRYAEEDATKRWNEIMTTKKGKMEWDEYEFQNFGSKETIESSIDGSIKDMITKEKVRWKAADADEDGLLDKSEFSAFLHPESSKSMDDVVAQETLEEMDLDGDGFVDMKEFLNDLVGESDDDEEEDDVEWIETEKHNFKDNLDADHDGKLNKDELKKWLLSDDHEQIVEETEHLFNQADVNQDNFLSKQEVLDKYDVFVGSQATDYGDFLSQHDEF